jgi:hypothetical protein
MTTQEFRSIIESEGFRIEHLREMDPSPVFCTAVKEPASRRRG